MFQKKKVDVDEKTVTEPTEGQTEEIEKVITGFKVVSVFDVSQTEGKELPSYGVDMLQGGVDDYPNFFQAIREIAPVPVGFEDIPGEAHGYYHQTEKRIAIAEGMSEIQNVKTLLHEIAHAKLHDIDRDVPEEQQKKSARSVYKRGTGRKHRLCHLSALRHGYVRVFVCIYCWLEYGQRSTRVESIFRHDPKYVKGDDYRD